MSNKDAYWEKTKKHMFITLALWAFFSLVIFMFGSELNTMSFLGYPLAYYMTAQGCLLYTSPSPRDVEESRMPSSA